ncbi:MAG: post-PEP-CTERM-1 domain-containing protein [Terriglobales bacterium]
MEKTISAFTRRLALAVAFSMLLGATAFAQKAQKSDGRAATAAEKAAFLEAVKKLVNRSAEGLQVKTLPNGSKYMDLKGRFQSVAVAKVNPDGTVSVGCVTTETEAEAFLKDKGKPEADKKKTTETVTLAQEVK